LAASVAMALGWCFQLAVYLTIANGSAQDVRFWMAYSAIHCGNVLLIVGVPLARANPAFYVGRPVNSAAQAVLGGVLLSFFPPGVFMFPVTAPLGFLVGGITMATYIGILTLGRTLFDVPEDC